MDTKLAFEMICAAVEQHPRRRLKGQRIDEPQFGNFFVAFIEDGRERCVVNDRGLVIVTGDLDGAGNALATVPSLYDVMADSLLSELGL